MKTRSFAGWWRRHWYATFIVSLGSCRSASTGTGRPATMSS